ncbi:peroxiredoxin Q/BCP [Hathewaya proteolytica DSM 3090]|uniref:thioredoxin-dependent peroxiredoxin n=1 Tax=Hathewaya proteolytica DSM 3090 TaxID=1121331 RepID=A0A1M6TCV5_9CLOT|nr:peroxiredoxin [Hathewaya proteolytica]SHK54719.1 peroxiredoxin Q/BCP [Hathewaya proteolytica DSM 3090]
MEELKIGMKAPDFELLGSDDKTHSLKDFIGKNIVLYFYPKDNTAGCTKEAIAFKEIAGTYDELNTLIIGISRDTVASHKKFIDKHELNFLLLSDKEEVACKLYDVIKEKTMCGKKSMGIERSTFIIDPAGNIKNIFRGVKVPGHADAVLCELK